MPTSRALASCARIATWPGAYTRRMVDKLVCAECGAEADEHAEGWRVYGADGPLKLTAQGVKPGRYS